MRTFKTFFSIVGAVLIAALLHACGGGDALSGDTGRVRLLNASGGNTPLDLRVAGSTIAGNVAKGAASAYVEQESGSYTFQIGSTGSTTTLLTEVASVNKDGAHTLIAYVSGNALNAVYVDDSEDAPASGTAKFRVFNGANEAGSLDVYLTDAADTANDLSSATPVNAAVEGESFGAYGALGAGAYRLRITAAGDRDDVRLDVASIALADQQIATLVVTATAGGVLVNGVLLNQGGAATAYDNATRRVRLAADTTAVGRVTLADAGGNLLKQTSPSVGNYAVVPGDLSALTLKVDGTAVALPATTAAAGSDLTLMVYGDAAAARAVFFTDDNAAPTATGKSRLRLVHGVNGLASPMSLDIDFSAAASDVAYGASSAYYTFSVGTDMQFDVSAAGAAVLPGWQSSPEALSVYTLFVLGDSAAPLRVLRKDR